MSISGMVVVITGGTSGIGAVCTRHLAEQGARVVCVSNQRAQGETLQAELRGAGHESSFLFADVTEEESVKGLVAQVLERYGRIDAVHCNAGVWREGTVRDFNQADWDFVMGVNVKGTFTTLKYVVPVMERQGAGVIVITTSVAAFVGFPKHALYCASKGALESLVRCLATDHAGVIRAVGVCPGTIDTPMLAQTAGGWDRPLEALYDDIRQRIPVKRLGQPLDIARALAFLISDDARYINGTSLVLDGGTMALPPW